MTHDRTHIVAMTGSYFRGDAEPVLPPQDEARFEAVTYTYYEQLNGYEHLKRLDIDYFFYTGTAPTTSSECSTRTKGRSFTPPTSIRERAPKIKIREVQHIIEELDEWQGTDPVTGFQLVQTPGGRVLRMADLVDDDPARRERTAAALRDPDQNANRDHVAIIVTLGMAKERFDSGPRPTPSSPPFAPWTTIHGSSPASCRAATSPICRSPGAASARAGLEDARIHDLRHCFASRALALGEGLPIIGRLLGHRRVETTARYAHLARDSVRESAERIAVSIAADIL